MLQRITDVQAFYIFDVLCDNLNAKGSECQAELMIIAKTNVGEDQDNLITTNFRMTFWTDIRCKYENKHTIQIYLHDFMA